MATEVGIKFKVIDLVSGSVKRITDSMTAFNGKLTSSNRFLNESSNRLRLQQGRIQALNPTIASLSTTLQKFQHRRDNAFSTVNIRKYNQKIYETERRLNKLKNLPPLSLSARFGRMTNDMGSTLGQAVRLGGAFAVFNGIKSIASLGTDMEQTRISFGTMLGDMNKGNALIDKLNGFANVTPFQNKDLMDASKVLLNFGIAGKEVMPILKTLGDVSGGNKQKLDSLTLAFAQVQSAGKLTGDDLRQMIDVGFNPLQELSRTSGKSMAVLKEEMSKGGISAGMVSKAFQTATSKGGRYFEMMKKQSQTTAGKWSTFLGKMQMIGIRIGEAMLPILNIGIQVLTKLVSLIPPVLDAFGGLFGFFAEHKPLLWGLVGLTGMWAASLLVAKFTLIKTAVATKLLALKQWALNIAMNANPIGLIITGVALLAAGIYWAYQKFDAFRGPAQRVYHPKHTGGGCRVVYPKGRKSCTPRGASRVPQGAQAVYPLDFTPHALTEGSSFFITPNAPLYQWGFVVL